MLTDPATNGQSQCITYSFMPQNCNGSYTFTCKVVNPAGYSQTTTVNVFTGGKNYF